MRGGSSPRDPGHPRGNTLQASTLLVPGARQNSPWQRFMSNISRYSGKANLNVRDVASAKFFQAGHQADKIKEMEERLQEQKGIMDEIGDKATSAAAECDKSELAYNKSRKVFMELKEEIKNIKKMMSKVDNLQRKMEEARANAGKNIVDEKKAKIRTVRNLVNNSIKQQKIMNLEFDKMMEYTFER